MNRQQRRAARIRDPNGIWLTPQLVRIVDRDPNGRPLTLRRCYDDERMGDVVPAGENRAEFLLLWIAEKDWKQS